MNAEVDTACPRGQSVKTCGPDRRAATRAPLPPASRFATRPPDCQYNNVVLGSLDPIGVLAALALLVLIYRLATHRRTRGVRRILLLTVGLLLLATVVWNTAVTFF